jgi:RimJ/RimL family protein N-acetyltransferase
MYNLGMKFPIQVTTKSGLKLTIRPSRLSDAEAMIDFINPISSERTFITFQGEQLTLKEEQSYLKNMVKKVKNHESVQLLAIHDGKVVANTSIELNIRVNHHVGTFAIAISKEYRGEGLGSTIIDLLFQYAKENLSSLKIVELKVFANNERAQHVYRKLGFKEYGRLPQGVFYQGEYIDEIFMYREI